MHAPLKQASLPVQESRHRRHSILHWGGDAALFVVAGISVQGLPSSQSSESQRGLSGSETRNSLLRHLPGPRAPSMVAGKTGFLRTHPEDSEQQYFPSSDQLFPPTVPRARTGLPRLTSVSFVIDLRVEEDVVNPILPPNTGWAEASGFQCPTLPSWEQANSSSGRG